MKKIALVAVNAKSSHSNPVIFLMRTLLEKHTGNQCQIIEMTINLSWKECLEILLAEDFTHYFFSVYVWNSILIQTLIPMIKSIKPNTIIIAGGPEAAYAENFGQTKGLDLVVEGQAEGFIEEYVSPSWKDKINDNKTAARIKVRPVPIDQSPFPYKLIDKEVLKGRLVYYEASRGCRFHCVYCLSGRQDQCLEYRDLKTAKSHLHMLIEIEPSIVKMVDRTFNENRNFARNIWEYLIDIQSPVPFHFELHPVLLDDCDFQILKKAPKGLFFFEAGIQSTDSEVLKKSGRAGDWEKISSNLKRLCAMKNIHTHVDQIVGLPGDTFRTAKNSFHQILNLNPDEFQVGFLKVLPGTALERMSTEYRMCFSSQSPYEVYQTADMMFFEFKMFYDVERLVRQYYNSDFFSAVFAFLIPKIPDCWTFFEVLKKNNIAESNSRQWPILAKNLLTTAVQFFPDDQDYIKDLLRFDWCRFAPSQGYPDFLPADQEIREKRTALYLYLKVAFNNISQQDFYHSFVFIPFSKKMKEELDGSIVVFLNRNGKREQVKIPVDALERIPKRKKN